ncbi:MAG: right-handed parallel beta-helix repeat-containing protein [Saprospiraceae bacterium]
MSKINLLVSFLLLTTFFSCKKNTTNIRLEKGMVISESVTILADTFRINSTEKLDEPAILIQGENIVVDFQGAVLKGSNDKKLPNTLYGMGILVKGKNIEIKNLNLQGYFIGILVTQADNLKINNSNLSYNFRCKNGNKNKIYQCSQPLDSKLGKIIAAGLMVNQSQKIVLENNQITHNNTGVILESGVTGEIYNNKITFNLNAGIVDMGNRDLILKHNYINWNRGPGLTSSSDSRNIIIAYNSLEQNASNLFWKNVNFSNNLFPQKVKPRNIDSLEKIYPPLSNPQNTDLPLLPYKGKEYWFDSDWGFYDFNFPAIWLREVNDDKYTFAIFGPEGNWKIVNGNGFVQTSRQSGSIPATIVATKEKNANPKNLSIELEFIGVEFTDQFGNVNPRGKTAKFKFKD